MHMIGESQTVTINKKQRRAELTLLPVFFVACITQYLSVSQCVHSGPFNDLLFAVHILKWTVTDFASMTNITFYVILSNSQASDSHTQPLPPSTLKLPSHSVATPIVSLSFPIFCSRIFLFFSNSSFDSGITQDAHSLIFAEISSHTCMPIS